MYATKGMTLSELLSCLLRRTGIFGRYEKGLAHLNYQEYEKAFAIWSTLAKAGRAQAQFDLGVMLHNGMGIEKDFEKSVFWFEKAAEQNHADAENYLGAIYKTGNGAQQNIEKALHYLKRAMQHGNETARLNYSKLLSQGLPEKYGEV